MEFDYSLLSNDPRYEYKHRNYLLNQKLRIEQSKAYREKHKEEISKKKKERVRCDICGVEIARASLHHHNLSKRHLKLESLAGKLPL